MQLNLLSTVDAVIEHERKRQAGNNKNNSDSSNRDDDDDHEKQQQQPSPLSSEQLLSRAQLLEQVHLQDKNKAEEALSLSRQCYIDSFFAAIEEQQVKSQQQKEQQMQVDPRAIQMLDQAACAESKGQLDEAAQLYRAAYKLCPELDTSDGSRLANLVIPLRKPVAEIPVTTVKLATANVVVNANANDENHPEDDDDSASVSHHRRPLRVVHISDTHSELYQLPSGCDVFIHSGDMTNDGTPAEIASFNHYLRTEVAPKCKVALIVLGNHENALGEKVNDIAIQEQILFAGLNCYSPTAAQAASSDLLHLAETSKSCIFVLLHDRSVLVGGCRFGGTPWMTMGPFYEADVGKRQKCVETLLKEHQVDVLVTHIPPQGILDLAGPMPIGCRGLLKALKAAPERVALHCFGHNHGKYGLMEQEFAVTAAAGEAPATALKRRILFSNAAMMEKRDAVPMVFELVS